MMKVSKNARTVALILLLGLITTLSVSVPKTNIVQACATTLSPTDSIQAAVDCNPAGTTFTLTPGVYRGQDIAAKANDTFIGQPSAILNGSKLLTSFTQQGNLWLATGQNQVRSPHGDCDATHPACGYVEDLYFDNTPLQRVANLNDVAAGKWYFDTAAGTVYLGSNPAGHTVEIGATGAAFGGAATGVTIRDLIIEKYANAAQTGAVGGDKWGSDKPVNWTLQNSEIRLNHGAGIALLDGAKISDNYIHDNGEMGYALSGNNIVFSNNELAFNNYAGFDCGWECGGGKATQTNNLIMSNNYSHDNYGPGFWTDTDNINTTYTGNVIANNQLEGIIHEISHSATITNNLLINNGGARPILYSGSFAGMMGPQILLWNSDSAQIYGNTLVVAPQGENGIGLFDTQRGNDSSGAPYLLANNSIHDNDITYSGSSGLMGIIKTVGNAITGTIDPTNAFDTNHYHAADAGGNHFYWNNPLSFSAFRQKGQETHGTMDATIFAHPLVVPAGVSNNPTAAGTLISTPVVPRLGQLININGTVYLVASNGLYGFPDAATFYSWGYKFSDIIAANSAETSLSMVGVVPTKQAGCTSPLNQINGGCGQSSSTTPRVGQLINIGQTVYLVGNVGLYGFPDAATFYSWGFTFNQIVPTNSAETALAMVGLVPTKQAGCTSPLNQINGSCAASQSAVRPGQVISINRTVCLVSNNGLYGFPDAATFYSWGFTFNSIVAANNAESALPVIGIVPTKQAGCANPPSQISGSCGS